MLKKLWNWYKSLGNRGGGEEEKTTTVTPPPPPAIEKTAAQIQAETGAAMKGAFETGKELYPEQYALYQAFMPQLLQQLQQPEYMTPQEQAAQQATRGRQTERLQEAMRTRANLGGGLYGGRAAGQEERAVSELGQAYAGQDVAQRMQRQQMLYGAISPYAQAIPQMAQQGVVDPNQIYNAYVQRMMAQTPEVFYTPGGSSGAGGTAGQLGGMALGALLAAPTGGMSIPMGAMLGGSAGSAFGSFF